MMHKVNLSVDGVIIGYEQVPDDQATAAPAPDAMALYFDHRPDLEPGKYRWNGETFVLAHPNVPFTPTGPDAWYAVYRLMRWINRVTRDNPSLPAMPAPCRVWMEYYRKSFTGDVQE